MSRLHVRLERPVVHDARGEHRGVLARAGHVDRAGKLARCDQFGSGQFVARQIGGALQLVDTELVASEKRCDQFDVIGLARM